MRISIIVAVDRNMAIGADNKLIYWLPDDLKRFKQLTTGNTIIMGRKTFESLPKGALPNRRNIVLTRSKDAFLEGADRFDSLKKALDDCRKRDCEGDERSKEVFIIGGASVYKQAIELADRICLTEIDATSDKADTFSLNSTVMNGKKHGAKTTRQMNVISFLSLLWIWKEWVTT